MLCPGPRSGHAAVGDAALRRPDVGGNCDAFPFDCGDADGGGQDTHGHLAHDPGGPLRQRGSSGHRQRLPGGPRCGMDAAGLRKCGVERGGDRIADDAKPAPRGLRLRRDLRHGQGIRLRFSPRSVAVAAGFRRTLEPAGADVGTGRGDL